MDDTEKTVIIQTDVGNLVLTQAKARQLINDIAKQISLEITTPQQVNITQSMLDAGTREGFLTTDLEKPHWLLTPQEVHGILHRAYTAMRLLEP